MMHILMSISLLIFVSGLLIPLVSGQPENEDEYDDRIPVVLIHGYVQDDTVWNTWEEWLRTDNFLNVYPIKFEQNDRCGSAQQHAKELDDIVNIILANTGHKQVNIVGYSKGGLDARAFLASGTDKVANLIMIGTPNDQR
jgi:triacylglycerol esterase/lipase EstA (alpha/beta hydrolase family)